MLVAEGMQEHPGPQGQLPGWRSPYVVPPVGMGSGFPRPLCGPMWAAGQCQDWACALG